MDNSERVCQSDARCTIRLPYEAELGGVCNSDSHVRRSELKLIANSTGLIWSIASVADKCRLKLSVSCVGREWALRYIWAIGCHLAQQPVWCRVEQPVLVLVGAHRFSVG